MGTQYLRKNDSIGSGLGAGASNKYATTRYATTPLRVSYLLLPRANSSNLKNLTQVAFFGTSATIIPLSISLGSANRAVTMARSIGLNPLLSLGSANRVVTMARSIGLNPLLSLGSANRVVTMARSIGLNPSLSLGSANRAVTMGVVSGFLLPLAISLGSANRTISTSTLLRVPLPVSLGSANRTVTMGRLIALVQSITYPRNSFITMASNPLRPLSLSVPWTGTVTMGVFVDSGGGSNPQVNASVAKVTGYSLTSVIKTIPTMTIDRAISIGMSVTVKIPTFFDLSKTIVLRRVEGSDQTLSLGPFRIEDESVLDRMTPQELMENRGIPQNRL